MAVCSPVTWDGGWPSSRLSGPPHFWDLSVIIHLVTPLPLCGSIETAPSIKMTPGGFHFPKVELSYGGSSLPPPWGWGALCPPRPPIQRVVICIFLIQYTSSGFSAQKQAGALKKQAGRSCPPSTFPVAPPAGRTWEEPLQIRPLPRSSRSVASDSL